MEPCSIVKRRLVAVWQKSEHTPKTAAREVAYTARCCSQSRRPTCRGTNGSEGRQSKRRRTRRCERLFGKATSEIRRALSAFGSAHKLASPIRRTLEPTIHTGAQRGRLMPAAAGLRSPSSAVRRLNLPGTLITHPSAASIRSAGGKSYLISSGTCGPRRGSPAVPAMSMRAKLIIPPAPRARARV